MESLLYINDLPISVPGGKIKLFANDTNLFASAKTMNKLESKANSFLLNLDSWLKANKLHLNIDKTCYSVFAPNKIPVPTVINAKNCSLYTLLTATDRKPQKS